MLRSLHHFLEVQQNEVIEKERPERWKNLKTINGKPTDEEEFARVNF